MAIFPLVEVEKKIQTGDKTRIDGSKSFISKGEDPITLVEIEPEGGNGFIDVTGTSQRDWFLDWVYTGSTRDVTVSVRITTSGAPITKTATLPVITSSDDHLFSSDSDLILHEHDILKYVKPGRSSFLNVHRRAQEFMLDWFNQQNYRMSDGTAITKEAIIDTNEVTEWSKFLTLQFIFQDLSNAIDDVFDRKSKLYESKAIDARDRGIVRLDLDGDEEINLGEAINLQTLDLVRR